MPGELPKQLELGASQRRDSRSGKARFGVAGAQRPRAEEARRTQTMAVLGEQWRGEIKSRLSTSMISPDPLCVACLQLNSKWKVQLLNHRVSSVIYAIV